MANRGAKVQPVKQRPIKTTWLKNALSAVGSSSRSVLGDYAPTITGAVKTGAEFARSMATSVRGTRRGSMGTNLNQNKYVKLANTAFKNALDDLKSGHLAGNDSRIGDSFMGDGGFDNLFDSSGGSGVSFGDEGGGNVTINNVNAAGSAEAFTSLNSSISKQTELTLRTSKAQTDAFVSLTSAQFFQSQQIGGQILEHLSAMNQNLAALVEYNSTNMNKFIESSLAFYDKAGQAMTKKESDEADDDDGNINKVVGAHGGFDVEAYKKYVTKRLKENLSNSGLGMITSIMDENSLKALAADPLGMASKMVVQYAVPEVISSTIKGMDQAISGAMPLMMKKLYDWGEAQGNDWFGKITGTLAKSFGYRAERTNFIDRKNDIEVKTDAVPFDGETKLAITTTITKELTTQTQYLRYIAEHMGGNGKGTVNKNKKNLASYMGQRESFDFEEHKYITYDQRDNNMLKGIADAVIDGFNNSTFGKNLTAVINSVEDPKDKKNMQSLQKQLYMMLDRESANPNADFTFKDGKASKAMLKAIERMAGDKKSKERFKNIIRDIGANDPNGGNTLVQGQIYANANRNKKIEEYRKNPTQSGILQTDLFERIGPDGKVIPIDKLLKDYIETDATGMSSKGIKAKPVSYRDAVNNDSFANGDMMAFSDQLRKATMQHMSNMGNAFASGDSRALMQEAGSMIGGVATTIVSSIDNKLLKPMSAKLFGTKDRDGFRRGGALSSMTNMLHDSFLEMEHRFTGKAYVDSEGRTHEKSEDSIIGTVKEGIMEKIFGKKDEETGERERKGIFTGIKDSIKQSFADWHNAMFGDTDKNGEAVTKDNVMKLMEDSLKKKLPDAMVGGVAGGAAGLVSGGLLGAMIGGPIGGVILGSAVGFAHKSDKFQKFMFGDPDKDNGLITKKTQEFVSKNKNALIGGAAIGGLKGAITGGGFLGTLVGGPVAGALLGMAATTAFKSKAFHDFLFGDEKRGSIGVINSFKNVFAHVKDKNKDEAGFSLTGKTVGMGATGAAAGALTATLLSQIGFMPAMLTAGGPIGGAIVGLGLAIKAQSDTFSRWLFGNRKDKNDPEYKAGVIGQLGNTLQAHIVQPFKNTVEYIADDMRITFKYNILGAIENAIQPIGEAAADMAFWVKKRATNIFNFVGDTIRDKIADPFVSLIRDTLIKPFATLGTKVAKLSYNVAKQAVLLPFRVLNGITHAIVSPIRKVLHPIKFAKRIMNAIMTGFERATGLSLDPIRRASEVVGEGMKKGVKGILSAPFRAVGAVATGIGTAVGAANNVIEDVDQRYNMRKMEKAGLFNDEKLYEKYKKDKNRGDKSYKDWKAEYVRSKNKSGYDYTERLKNTYERMSANGQIKPNEDGSMPSFEDWKKDYMRSDFSTRFKIQKANEKGERAEAKVKYIERNKRNKNQKKILKYTGGNQWEDTVQNRAEAEAKAGKKIRWYGDAIDSEEQKRKSEEIKDAATLDDKGLATADPKKSSNEVRQLSILQQILNVIKGLNPDGSDLKHPNLFSNNFNDDNKSGRNDDYNGAGLYDAGDNVSDILRANEISPEAADGSGRFAVFGDSARDKGHADASILGDDNQERGDYDVVGMNDSKPGVLSRIFNRKKKKKHDAGMSARTASAYEEILNNTSGRGYAEGTDNAEEGYSIVGEAGRPEIVWTNKGDKVYSDKRKPIRVEIADFARSAVSKFVKYIRKAVGGGGDNDNADAIPTMGGSQAAISGPTMGSGPAALPGPTDTRTAANAYSMIDDGEPAENNATTGYSGAGGLPVAIMNTNDSEEGSQTDIQFDSNSVVASPRMAIVRGKQELRDKTLDAALTADEAMAAKEAEEKESRMNRILDAVEGMADHTKKQVKKTFDFFKDWGKIFGKKGLITAGLVGLLAFLNKSGLLQKLLDFIGKGVGNVGQAISDAFSQASEDSEWNKKNRANTNGKSGGEEFQGFINDIKEFFSGDILGFLTNDEGDVDAATTAKTRLLYYLAKKPVQIMYALGKGVVKGAGAVFKGVAKGVGAVGKGVGNLIQRTLGQTNFGKGVTDVINTLKGSYTLGKNSTNMPMGSASTYDNLATSDYTIGGSESFDLPDTDETSWFAEMNNAPSDADGALNSLDKMGNDVANDVSDATVNTASKGGENLGSSIASEVGDATVSSGTNAAANTTGAVGNAMDNAAASGANQIDNVASSAMTGSTVETATNATAHVASNQTDNAIEATARAASNQADNVMSAVAANKADDVVEQGANLVLNSADEVAEKSTSKLKKKIISMLQSFFEQVGAKVGSAQAAKGKLADSWIGKIMGKITKAFTSEGIFGKIAKKVTAALSAKVSIGTVTIGVSQAVFLTLGAINGITGTARLFQVNKNKVDNTMRVISAALGAFTQTFTGTVVDIVNEVIAASCGFDVLNTAACMIYELIMGKENYDDLQADRASFKDEYIKDRDEKLKSQYEVLKKAGLTEGKYDDEKAYIEAVNNGEVNGKYESFQDYNSDKNASVMEKGTKKVVNALKKPASAISKWWNGSDESHEGYFGVSGNKYLKNKDGSYTIYDKEGNELGTVGDESNFKDDIAGTYHQAGKHTKGAKDAVVSAGKKVIKVAGEVKDGIATAVDNVAKNASAFASGVVKAGETAWNFFTKKETRTDTGYDLNDGSGQWYDMDGYLHNADGTKTNKQIGSTDLEYLYRAGLVTETKHETVIGGTGFEKLVDSGKKKVSGALSALGSKASEVGSNIVKTVTDFGSKAKEFGAGVVKAGKNVWDFFHKRDKKIDSTWDLKDGTGRFYDDTGQLYSADGEKLDEGSISNEELSYLINANLVTPSRWESKTKFEKWKDNVKEKVSDGLKNIKDSALKTAKNVWDAGLAWAANNRKIAKKYLRIVVGIPGMAKEFFGSHADYKYIESDGSYWMRKSMGATSGDSKWYHYNVNGELISDEGVDGDYIEGMYTSGALSREKVKTSGAKELWQHTIKPGLRKAKEKVVDALKGGFKAVGSFVKSAASTVADKYKKYSNWTQRNRKFLKGLVMTTKETRYMEADGGYYVKSDFGYTHYNPNGDIIEDAVDADVVEPMINSGLLQPVEHKEDSKVSQIWKNTIKPGLVKVKDTVFTAFSNGYKAVSTFTSNFLKSANHKIDLMQNWGGRRVDDVKAFFVGKKETRWMAPDETYYVASVNGFTHYNKLGDIIEDAVDADEVASMIFAGTLTSVKYTEPSGMSKIGKSLVEHGKQVVGAFQNGVSAVATGLQNFSIGVQRFKSSVEKYGMIHTVANLFKKQTSVGYFEPTGNYYKRKGSSWEYYSQAGDLLESGISDEEVEAKMQAGMITPHEVTEDAPAKKAIDEIQKAAKSAWESAKSVVAGGWAKFTNWLKGGSGSGKPKTRGSSGGFGYNVASFTEKEYGELPQFADSSAGGSGDGAKGNVFRRAIQMRQAMNHGFGSGPRRAMGGGFGKSKFGNAAPDTVNGHSYYAQTDKRWAKDRYEYNGDGGTLGDSGCGPAAMSMVVADMAGTNVDPRKMAVLAQETGTRDNTGTNWNFVSGAADTFGLHSEQRYSPSANFISDSLRSGNEVVLSGTSSGQGTPYTTAGHYVVAVGQDSDGRIRVNDPRGKSFSRSYTPQELVKYTGSAWSIGNGGSGSKRPAYNHYTKGGYGKDDKKDKDKDKKNDKKNDKKATTKSSGSTNYAGDSADMLNGFPYLLQGDSRWGSIQYSSIGDPSQTIASSACGPTSMAIILRSFGVDITPKETCQYALDNGMRTANSGTSWDFFPSIGSKYGLTTEELGVSESGIVNSLKNAKPVIASMGPGTFTQGGHFIDLVGIKDGKIVVNDCASKERSQRTYSPSVFTSEGSNFWAFSKNGKGSIGNVAALGSIAGTNTNGTETTVTEGSPIDKMGSFFGEVANRALEGALTGNWNTDFTSFWNPSTGTTTTDATATTTTTTTPTASSGNLQGNEVTEQVYNYLTTTGGMTPYGAAGLMGNLEAESGINPGIVEGLLAKKLGTTSAQYTADVDSGKISKNDFLHPLGKQYGYGLAQWTSPGRKQGLYDLVKSRNVSIADTKSQLDWLLQELQSSSYAPVYNVLKSATSLKEASDVVLHKFESPADQSSAVEAKRASMGQNWYNKYAGAAGKGGFGVKFLRTINKIMGGKGGMNALLNRLKGGRGSTAADAREALVNWMLCIVERNTYTQSGDRSRVMEGVDGHGYGDCSSTCCKIYETALGKVIGSYTGDMIGAGTVVDGPNGTMGTYPDESKMLPGDLVFFYSKGSSGQDGHVEMYIGNGQLCGHGGSNDPGPRIHGIKNYIDGRTGSGRGTWIQVVRYVNDGETYNINEPDKSKMKVQNTFTDGKGNSANGANTGATTTTTGSTDATTTTTGGQEGNSVIDKIGNFFGEVSNRAVEGTLTGNWNTDFNSFWNGTTTTTSSGDATATSSTIPGNFPKYTFTDEQKKYIAQIMMRENGGENLAITKDGASHMANLSEVQFHHPATAESLVNMIKTSGWFGAGGGNIPDYAQNPNQNVYDAITQVLEQGNRTLPRYVTEYDMFPKDAAIAGHWYNGRDGENQADYVKHKTLITQNASRGLTAKYTFYKFFGDNCRLGDVSGYYERYYQQYKDDDPRPDGVTPEPGGSGVGVRRKNRLSDPEVLRKIHIIGGQGGYGGETDNSNNTNTDAQEAPQEPEVYAPTRAQINNRMLARARLMEKRSNAYQRYLDTVQRRENMKHGGHGVTATSNTGFINANTTTYGGSNYTSSSTLSEIMTRADAAKSSKNDSELLRCMIEILAIIADNTGKGVTGLSQATELLANLKSGGNTVVVNKGGDTPVVSTLKQEGSKPTKNMKLAQQIAAGK